MVLSVFALTPIDSIAFEYQLSDVNIPARLVLLRFVGFDFFSFYLSCSGVMGLTWTLVRTKPPFLLSIRCIIDQQRIANEQDSPRGDRRSIIVFLRGATVVPQTLATLGQNYAGLKGFCTEVPVA